MNETVSWYTWNLYHLLHLNFDDIHASCVAWTTVANKIYGASVALEVILEHAGRQLLLLPVILALKGETKHVFYAYIFPSLNAPKPQSQFPVSVG